MIRRETFCLSALLFAVAWALFGPSFSGAPVVRLDWSAGLQEWESFAVFDSRTVSPCISDLRCQDFNFIGVTTNNFYLHTNRVHDISVLMVAIIDTRSGNAPVLSVTNLRIAFVAP